MVKFVKIERTALVNILGQKGLACQILVGAPKEVLKLQGVNVLGKLYMKFDGSQQEVHSC